MSSEMITCSNCGSAMPANTRFCSQCGYKNEALAPPSETVGFSPPAAEGDTPPGGAPTVNISGPAGYAPYAAPQGQYSGGFTPPAAEEVRVEPPSTPAYAPPPQPASVFAPPPAQSYAPTQELQVGAPQAQPPAAGYGGYSAQPLNYQYQPQPGVAGVPQRDPTVALLLELIGYVWVLGIGHMYGGRIGRGVALLLVWWAYWGIAAFLAITLIGIPVACIMALAWPAVPILSGLWIKNDLERDNTVARQRY